MAHGANSIDLYGELQPMQLAQELVVEYDKLKNYRVTWEEQVKELRDYLYAVDTGTTANITNPFSNRTTVPKLSQIAQNIHANYLEHMFSNANWIQWEAHNFDSSLLEKKRTIESYIKTKARQQSLTEEMGKIVWDWILYGNCFAQMKYVNEFKIEPDGTRVQGYVGPKLCRISPHDIVFNPAAESFCKSPKFIRKLLSIGEIRHILDTEGEANEFGITEAVYNKSLKNRAYVKNNAKYIDRADVDKTQGYVADGFSDLMTYYNSDLIEILEFYGDYYDGGEGKMYPNCKIVIMDRIDITKKDPSPSWSGSHYIYHSAWHSRPDNLYGMGPLDNLVGMQYKIDKLENTRADIYDHIAWPTTVEVGTVEFFGQRGAPGGRYVVEEGGDVKYLAPDTTALQADMQIQQTMRDMEELAGSPREAMGIRSPGEKTAFEVQTLDNAANRLFRHKVAKFESEFVEPVLNDMLEMARRNLDGADIVRAENEVFNITEFVSITKEDLTAAGKLYPIGSKRFISNNNMLQNLQTLFSTPVGEMISPHVSKMKLAKAVEDILSIEELGIVEDNIGVIEDVETQRMVQSGQKQLEEEYLVDNTDMFDDEIAEEQTGPAPF